MKELTKNCIEWIKNYFITTNGKKAIIGISGGKDSTVCAALCVEALGKDNVIGIMMPNGNQSDISDSIKICKFLDIQSKTINIEDVYTVFFNNILDSEFYLTTQTKNNLAPRIRTTLLYAIAQSFNGGRVCNTSNLCEKMIGWGTLWADTIGDFSPLGNLTVSEIKEIGLDLGLPQELVVKAPADGLTGKTDEENFGFTYDELEKVITIYLEIKDINQNFFKMIGDLGFEKSEKILKMIKDSQFKRDMIHIPTFDLNKN